MTTYEGDYILFVYLQSTLREYVYKRVQKNQKNWKPFFEVLKKIMGIRKSIDNKI